MPLEADAGLTALAMQQGDDKTFAQFYMRSVQDKVETVAQGRPIFVEKPYIKIMVPGDKDNIVDRPVRSTDKERYPRQWQAFEQKLEQPLEGTPLAEWPGLTRAQVDELAFFGVKTVEALASLADAQAQKFMGIQALKAKANDYLEAAKTNAPLDQLREENMMLQNKLAALEDQIAQLAAEQKPSRRRKSAEE